MMAGPSKDSSAQLRRFLYLGDESKRYPDCVTFPFQSEKIQSIFDNPGSPEHVVREIVHVYRDGHYLGLEPILYALAVFLHSKDHDIKETALKAVCDICVSSSAMFIFSHIYNEVCKPAKGWSRSHRKFLSNWYNSKEAQDLASEVVKTRSYKKWTHKDIFCMAHIKAEKIGTAAVLKYLTKGYEAAEKDFSSEAEAESVLKFLKGIEELNRASSGEIAARLVEIHELCLEHIPSHLVKTKEVSLCLIPRVPIKNLLSLIPHYCKLGLLKLNSPHYKALLERLSSEEALSDSSIDPLESFLAIKRWQLSNRIFASKAIIRQNTPAIDDSLQSLHLASFKSLIPTQKRYLIAVDIRPSMVQKLCHNSKCVAPSNVSEIVTLALVKAELSNVTVLVFSPEELVPVDINNKMTISDVNEHINKVVPGPVNLCAPIQWAITKKKAYDLFVVFSDCITNVDHLHSAAAFTEYKPLVKSPHTKLILATLCDVKATSFDNPDMLNIVGFNIKLLKIIQDFACGKF